MTKNKLFAWAITLLCFSLTSCSDEKDGPSEKILVTNAGVTEAMKKYEIDPSQSYMFGDKKSDTECGERSGVKSFRVTSEHSLLYWANQLKNNLL